MSKEKVEKKENMTGRPSLATAEVTITPAGQFGMTPERFIALLHANGYAGNTSMNPNYPNTAWIGFWNDTSEETGADLKS